MFWHGMYHLCSDNIDKTVKQCYMRSDAQKLDLPTIHSYAVEDRIDFSFLPPTTPPVPPVDVQQLATSLLPSHRWRCSLTWKFYQSCITYSIWQYWYIQACVWWRSLLAYQSWRKSDLVNISVTHGWLLYNPFYIIGTTWNHRKQGWWNGGNHEQSSSVCAKHWVHWKLFCSWTKHFFDVV